MQSASTYTLQPSLIMDQSDHAICCCRGRAAERLNRLHRTAEPPRVRMHSLMLVELLMSNSVCAQELEDSGKEVALDSLSSIVRAMASGEVRRYLEGREQQWQVSTGHAP